jgi:predicted aspartyl protease
MILGRFRDDLPRITVELAGIAGPVKVEFIVDTGFDGYLTLPPSVLRRLHATPLFETVRALGDGTLREFSA